MEYKKTEGRDQNHQEKISSYLLPVNHPLQIQLRSLFNDSKMFRSADGFRKARI